MCSGCKRFSEHSWNVLHVNQNILEYSQSSVAHSVITKILLFRNLTLIMIDYVEYLKKYKTKEVELKHGEVLTWRGRSDYLAAIYARLQLTSFKKAVENFAKFVILKILRFGSLETT